MKFKGRQSIVITNLLIAVAISLIVNFSHLLFSLQGLHTGRESRFVLQNPHLFLWLQILYAFVQALILVTISTYTRKGHGKSKFVSRVIYGLIVTTILYFCAPVATREGDITIVGAAHMFINPMVVLKSSFTLIVALLYGKIFDLIYQKQSIVIENERLKNENLLTRYNMLVSQINPHFFFNSLNSLSMLVRGKHNDKAITYIDRLSDTFRYILQKGSNDLVTLEDEMEYLSGYKYLNEVRYADKLFIDIETDESCKEWLLPALSLQPLVENAVKHNSITLSKPFHITIRTEEGELIVSNPVIPKIVSEEGTGIGLKNLSSRFLLLTGQDIRIENDGTTFTVRMPLTRP